MNFAKIARQSLIDPCAIRRVEEADSSLTPITHDEITNLRIMIGLYPDPKDLSVLDYPRKPIEVEEESTDWFGDIL